MLNTRELIRKVHSSGLRNAIPVDDTFSVQTKTRALFIGDMPDPMTGDLALYVSLFFGDANAASMETMVNLVLRHDAEIDMFLLEIQNEQASMTPELLAFARMLGLEDPNGAVAIDESDARLKIDLMVAEVRRSMGAFLLEELT